MRVPQRDIDHVNNSGQMLDQPDAVPTRVLAVWHIRHVGHCVDPTCRLKHVFDIALSITDDLITDKLPQGKLMVGEGTGDDEVRVPLDKNQIVELIADLQEMLGEMP